MKILIIEDEQKLAQSIYDYLKKEENYICEIANTFKCGSEKIVLFLIPTVGRPLRNMRSIYWAMDKIGFNENALMNYLGKNPK